MEIHVGQALRRVNASLVGIKKDSFIFGIARMNGTESRYCIKGICAPFSYELGGDMFCFHGLYESLFFSGRGKEWIDNYNRDRVPDNLDLDEFLDRKRSPESAVRTNQSFLDDYFDVPFSQLGLDGNHLSIAKQIVPITARELSSELMKECEEYKASGDSSAHKRFVRCLCNFPSWFRDAIVSNGSYVHAKFNKKSAIKGVFEVSEGTVERRVISAPVESLPDWAKDLWGVKGIRYSAH